jgi:hypothetical protein
VKTAFRHSLLGAARTAAGLAPRNAGVAWQREREERLAAWSAHVKAQLDVELIARLVGR